jgi:hypothetical protein
MKQKDPAGFQWKSLIQEESGAGEADDVGLKLRSACW